MDFSYDGTVLASCSYDGLLRLWDTSTGHCLKTLAIDNGDHPLSCVSFSPNGEAGSMRGDSKGRAGPVILELGGWQLHARMHGTGPPLCIPEQH